MRNFSYSAIAFSWLSLAHFDSEIIWENHGSHVCRLENTRHVTAPNSRYPTDIYWFLFLQLMGNHKLLSLIPDLVES